MHATRGNTLRSVVISERTLCARASVCVRASVRVLKIDFAKLYRRISRTLISSVCFVTCNNRAAD